VTYTSATRFARTVAGKVADGQCVTVTGAPVSGSSDTLTATSVRIEAKVNGACPTATARTGGFGGGQGGNGSQAGQGGQGFQGGSAAPRPSGAPSGQFRDFAFATGTVSTVSGSTVTIQGVLREGRPTAGQSSTPSTASAPSPITVMLASTTTVTETVPATKAAAVVGMCATAIGKADDRGDIAATAITITKPDANGCRTGFGGFGRGATGTAATPGSGTSA
jgi:hypothetical protein